MFERLHFIIIFLICFILYNNILWYYPLKSKINNLDENVYLLDNINDIEAHLYNNNPIITDGRQLFKYTWNNFEIPLFLIKDNLVAGEINLSLEELSSETNVSYSKKTNYLSMFNNKNYHYLDNIIYRVFKLPPFFNQLYSYYINDIIVSNSNHITPYFLNNDTYHIFYICDGDATFHFLSRKYYLENPEIKIEKEMNYIYSDFKLSTLNIHETNDKKSINCKKNSFIIIPFNWIYSIETINSCVILSYYYKSYLNNTINFMKDNEKYFELNI